MIQENEALFASYRRTLRARNRSEETIGSYRKALAEFDSWFGRGLTEATKADVTAWLEHRLTEVSATTVAIRFRSLRAFYRWLETEDEIAKSPFDGVKEPKVSAAPVVVLSDDDLKKLLKACVGREFEDRRDEALIRLFCEPGSPRLGEMAGVRMEDLDMSKDYVRVAGKTGERLVPFGAKTGQSLDRYLRMRGKHPKAAEEALWVGNKGVLSDGGIAQILARRSQQAGLPRIHPHQLRHTSASRWLEAGGSEGDAVELFGWADATMIHRVYGKSAAGERARGAAKRASMGDRL